MTPNTLPNKVAAEINKMADYIRKNSPVKFGELMMYMSMRPSTLHQYKKVLLDLCEDIRFEHGLFIAEMHHRMPDGKLVPAEK
jgi:hypothetical protein